LTAAIATRTRRCAPFATTLRAACRSAARETDLSAHERVLDRNRSALLVIDLQESYRGKLHREDAVVAASQRMIEAAGILGVPVLVTEQYPKGLGHTRAEIAARLPAGTPRIEKTSFSALGAPDLAARLDALARPQIVVIGIETHVCVDQTVHDLLALGRAVHVVRDAVTARFPLEDEIGWAKLLGSGAVPTTSECALFEWLRDAKAAEFKAIHRLVA
jgi:nicotinamidase-related amidase